jgi:hypothetical protein
MCKVPRLPLPFGITASDLAARFLGHEFFQCRFALWP